MNETVYPTESPLMRSVKMTVSMCVSDGRTRLRRYMSRERFRVKSDEPA
jgi:hypothetical protein